MDSFDAGRRQSLRLLVALSASTLAAGHASAANYPDRFVRLITPFGAGGVTDAVARLVARYLQSDLGQSVIVENTPGGSGIIGTQAVARAKPDGYSLLFTTNVHVINPALRHKLPFDPVKDFTPIVRVASAPLMLVVSASSPLRTVADYIAAAKRKPDTVTFGSSGVGTSPHLAGEQFAQATKTSYVHVPYNVSSAVTQALVAGQLDSSWSGVLSAMPFIKSGKLRALGIASDRRSKFAPDVPTLAELGVPGVNIDTWFGLLGPAHLPPAVVDKLSAAVLKAMSAAEFQDGLEKLGAEPAAANPAEFARIVSTELSSYAQLVAARNIKVE